MHNKLSGEVERLEPIESEEVFTQQVEAAGSLDELIEIVRSRPKIYGSQTYTGADAAELLEGFKTKRYGHGVITNANGIHDKAVELFRREGRQLPNK